MNDRMNYQKCARFSIEGNIVIKKREPMHLIGTVDLKNWAGGVRTRRCVPKSKKSGSFAFYLSILPERLYAVGAP